MKIKLLFKYIAFDVKQLSLRYSNVRLGDNPEVADQAAFGENDSDDQLLRRWVVTGTAKLRIILREYLEKKNEDADDTLTNKESWGFTFKEDLTDSHGTAELMHWFIVKWCIWQWAQMYVPNEANIVKGELDEAEEDIKNALLDSAMPTKDRRTDYDPSEDDEYIIDEEEIVYGA